MACSRVVHHFKPLVPWICSSIAIGYAAYLHWRLNKLRAQAAEKKTRLNDDKENIQRKLEINIDHIDRNVAEQKLYYCRCWKSSTFPLCDGSHKQHNKENDDAVGPLVVVWNKQDHAFAQDNVGGGGGDAASNVSDNMDIKSFDSESPILHSSNDDDNGESDKNVIVSSDEHLSEMEMLGESFTADSNDEDTLKVDDSM